MHNKIGRGINEKAFISIVCYGYFWMQRKCKLPHNCIIRIVKIIKRMWDALEKVSAVRKRIQTSSMMIEFQFWQVVLIRG
jgi:hypothetical protein